MVEASHFPISSPRTDHVAWVPASLPDTIVLLGGDNPNGQTVDFVPGLLLKDNKSFDIDQVALPRGS